MENNTSPQAPAQGKHGLVSWQSQPINIYAVLAVSLIVIAAIVLLTIFAYFISATLNQGTYSYYSSHASVIGLGYLLAVGTVFLTVPLLINLRYGWRTVITTVLCQSLLAFVVLGLLVLIFPADNPQVSPLLNGAFDTSLDNADR